MFQVPGWDVGEPVVEEQKASKAGSKKRIFPSGPGASAQEEVKPEVVAKKRKPDSLDARLSKAGSGAEKKKTSQGASAAQKGAEALKRPAQAPLNLSSKAASKLSGARFRYLNQKLYESSSKEALDYFQQNPDDFAHYHHGFREQTKAWPVNPIDRFIARLRRLVGKEKPKTIEVADLGCGEAQLARTFASERRVSVHSFDLVAVNEHVEVASMTNVPLANASMDIVIFSLSLMNTDYVEALQEAHRILKPKGEIWIAEVSSRLDDASGVDAFIASLKTQGFNVVEKVILSSGMGACANPRGRSRMCQTRCSSCCLEPRERGLPRPLQQQPFSSHVSIKSDDPSVRSILF